MNSKIIIFPKNNRFSIFIMYIINIRKHNVQFLPAVYSYGVYISQLIRYSRACVAAANKEVIA